MDYHMARIIFSNARFYIILHAFYLSRRKTSNINFVFSIYILDNFHPSTCLTMLSPKINMFFIIFTSRGFLFFMIVSVSSNWFWILCHCCIMIISWRYTLHLLCVLFSGSKLSLIILGISSFLKDSIINYSNLECNIVG